MICRPLLFVLLFVPFLIDAQSDEFEDTFDWVKFSKGTENEYVDDDVNDENFDVDEWEAEEEGLDVRDRSLDYHERNVNSPFHLNCGITSTMLPKELRKQSKSPLPKYNVTCNPVREKPLNINRHHTKEYCVIKHKKMANHINCETTYINVPIKMDWGWENLRVGAGCKCYRPMKDWIWE